MIVCGVQNLKSDIFCDLFSMLYFKFTFIYSLSLTVCARVFWVYSHNKCGGQRTTCRGWLSSSTVWVPGDIIQVVRIGIRCPYLLRHLASPAPYFLRQSFSMNLVLIQWAWLVDQQVLGILLSLPLWVLELQVNATPPIIFLWLLGIWTQVLVLVWQTFDQLSYLSDPWIKNKSSDRYNIVHCHNPIPCFLLFP